MTDDEFNILCVSAHVTDENSSMFSVWANVTDVRSKASSSFTYFPYLGATHVNMLFANERRHDLVRDRGASYYASELA